MKKDIQIKVNTETNQVLINSEILGISSENLQGNIIFKPEPFINGTCRLYVEGLGVIEMDKQEDCYTLPIKSSLLKSPGIDICFKIIEPTNEEGTPVFATKIIHLKVLDTIEDDSEIPEQYPTWIETFDSKIAEIDDKLEEVDSAISNIQDLTSAYNTNATNKTNEFNTNAKNKTNAFDQHYATKVTEIDGAVNSAKSELDEYTEDKKDEIDGCIDDLKAELDTYETSKEGDLDSHTSTKKTELNTYTNSKKSDLDDYEETKETALNTLAGNLTSAFNSNANSKTSDFNDNATSKTGDFNTNATNKTSAYDENASTKLGAYNTNHTTKLAEYNSNATSKVSDYNTNAITKTSEFDQNASDKTDDFDNNASAKTTAFNDNATAKIAEYDAHVSELQSQVDDLTTLVETELESNEVEGTEIDVSDSAEYRGRIEVKGNTEQKQLSGNQLVDFNSAIGDKRQTQSSFNDDILTVTGSETNYNYARIGITTQYKTNPGKVLKFVYDSIDINSQYGNVVQLRIVYNDGTPTAYQGLLKHNLQNVPQNIPDNVDNIDNVRLEIYSNNTSTSQNSSVTITKPMLQFGTETKDYEPYVGGQASPNPDYPQEIEVVTGNNVVKHVGKNRFDKSTEIVGKFPSSSGIIQDNSVWNLSDFISVINGETYTLSSIIATQNKQRLAITEYDKNKYFIKRTQSGGSVSDIANCQTIELQNTTRYVRVSYRNDTFTADSIQFELGSTPTPYEPYREEEYKLDLWKENEFDKDNANIYGGYLDTNGIVNGSGSGAYDTIVYIECKPNTTYLLKKTQQIDTENNRFRIGCTSEIPARNMQTTNFFKYADGTSETEYAYTTSSTARYLLFYCGRASETTSREQLLNSIQIQEAIELCKIGDYEDILFKNEVGDENYNAELENGACYKYKKINKHIFNGNNTDGLEFNTDGNTCLAVNLLPNNVSSSTFRYNGTDTRATMYCDKFLYIFGTGDTEHLYVTSVTQTQDGYYGNIRLYINHSRLAGYDSSLTNAEKIALLRNWLQENPITIYFILKTPTYEKITDPTLISQLEALRKAKWFKGINHWWTETDNLEPNLKGTYKQSNNIKNKERDERLDNLESRLALLE